MSRDGRYFIKMLHTRANGLVHEVYKVMDTKTNQQVDQDMATYNEALILANYLNQVSIFQKTGKIYEH